MSEINQCRVCKGPFLFPALLEYPNSPRAAQGFLDDLEELDDDEEDDDEIDYDDDLYTDDDDHFVG
jgi:hypothetical protein